MAGINLKWAYRQAVREGDAREATLLRKSARRQRVSLYPGFLRKKKVKKKKKKK